MILKSHGICLGLCETSTFQISYHRIVPSHPSTMQISLLTDFSTQIRTEARGTPANPSMSNSSTRTATNHLGEKKTLQVTYSYVLAVVHSRSCPTPFSVYDVMYLSSCQLTKREANAALYHMAKSGLLCMTSFDSSLRGVPLFWLPNATTSEVSQVNPPSAQATSRASS